MVEKDYCENPKCDNPNELREGDEFMIRWQTYEEPAEYAFFCNSCIARAEDDDRRYAETE